MTRTVDELSPSLRTRDEALGIVFVVKRKDGGGERYQLMPGTAAKLARSRKGQGVCWRKERQRGCGILIHKNKRSVRGRRQGCQVFSRLGGSGRWGFSRMVGEEGKDEGKDGERGLKSAERGGWREEEGVSLGWTGGLGQAWAGRGRDGRQWSLVSGWDS